MSKKHPPQKRKCDYPGCDKHDEFVKRFDIQVNWFRGDDVVMNACKEHRKDEHHSVLLKTEKAMKQK